MNEQQLNANEALAANLQQVAVSAFVQTLKSANISEEAKAALDTVEGLSSALRFADSLHQVETQKAASVAPSPFDAANQIIQSAIKEAGIVTQPSANQLFSESQKIASSDEWVNLMLAAGAETAKAALPQNGG